MFLEFAAKALDCGINVATIEMREPPEPGLWCQTREGPSYFELGRLLDPAMQKHKKRALLEAAKAFIDKRAPRLFKMDVMKVNLPEREMLRRKLTAQYETRGTPTSLLLYYDNENVLVGDVSAVDDFARHAAHVMKPLIDQAR
ncbi:MAG TPA: hypothetical protein VF341_13355, partial [Anaeromyxobacteraceae bacterium]